jgi:hypothetical protein
MNEEIKTENKELSIFRKGGVTWVAHVPTTGTLAGIDRSHATLGGLEILEKLLPAINTINNGCPVCIREFCKEVNKANLGWVLTPDPDGDVKNNTAVKIYKTAN